MQLPIIKTFYKEGYQLALENAKALYKVSDNTAKMNEYGIACSLNILAAEELIKAVVILTKNYQPQMDSKDFTDIFKSHNKKHKAILVVTFLSKYLIDFICSKYEENKLYFDAVDELPKEESYKFKQKYKHFYKIIESVKNDKRETYSFDDAMKWWIGANLLKNNGFYVDIKGDKWHNPRNYTKEQFEVERQYTKDLILNVETFNNLFSPIKLIRELKNLKV